IGPDWRRSGRKSASTKAMISIASLRKRPDKSRRTTQMSKRETPAVVDSWIEETRLAGGEANLVHAIEARLKNRPDEIARRVLNLALAGEYKEAERYRDAERIYLMLFAQSPDEPIPLILLAQQKLYRESEPAAAMLLIDRAIEASSRSSNFRR